MTKLRIKRIKSSIVAMFMAATLFSACSKREQPAAPSAVPPSQPTASAPSGSTPPAASPSPAPATSVPAQIADVSLKDLRRFDHSSARHKMLACETCHVRSDNSPTPRLPGHAGCIQCHANIYTDESFPRRQQFCTLCHVWPVEAAQIKLVSFPKHMQQFGLKGFSHRAHMDRSKMPSDQPPLQCSTCHKAGVRIVEVSDRGMQQVGMPRHAECYACHTPQSAKPGGSCGVCHTEKPSAVAVGSRASLAFTKFRFEHRAHLKSRRIDGDCAKCHKPVQADEAAKIDISSISARMGMRHSSSCWSCHVRAREPVCTKCHLGGPPIKVAMLPPRHLGPRWIVAARDHRHATG